MANFSPQTTLILLSASNIETVFCTDLHHHLHHLHIFLALHKRNCHITFARFGTVIYDPIRADVQGETEWIGLRNISNKRLSKNNILMGVSGEAVTGCIVYCHDGSSKGWLDIFVTYMNKSSTLSLRLNQLCSSLYLHCFLLLNIKVSY